MLLDKDGIADVYLHTEVSEVIQMMSLRNTEAGANGI